MKRTPITGKAVLAAGALVGLVVGLLLPAPAPHSVETTPFIRPGYSAQ